jgi:hypothetical protein
VFAVNTNETELTIPFANTRDHLVGSASRKGPFLDRGPVGKTGLFGPAA